MFWLTGFLWTADQPSSVLIFFIGVLPSLPIFMFFYEFFGGWDRDILEELAEAAASRTGFIRPLAKWGIYAPTALGVKISPLNGRFPISIRADAMTEAKALTEEKEKL
jgi:hypothetical protein